MFDHYYNVLKCGKSTDKLTMAQFKTKAPFAPEEFSVIYPEF